MSIDWDDALNSPMYAAMGVDAVLTLADNRIMPTIQVIDCTSGINVGANIDVPTILPCAAMRYSDLIAMGLNKDDIVGGTLAFNGSSWTISNVRPEPNQSGERKGEVYAELQDPTELASSES